MTCHDVEPLLSAYVDQELPADDFRTLSRHLALCQSCAGQRDALSGVKSVLHAQPRPSLPPDIRAAIRARTSGASIPERGSSPLKWWIPTLVFAAAAGSGLVSYLYKARSPGRPAAELIVQQPAPAPLALPQIAWHKPDISTSTLQ
jgi:anti-sigma factor RsiW